MANITLYTNKMSRGRIVQWMLEELGEPYETQIVEYGPNMKSAEYLSINGMGKVPALKHGEAIVTETPAILAYLADAFPQKGLIPVQGSAARAAFYRWLFFTAGPLEAATSANFLNWQTPEKTPGGNSAKGFLGFGTLELTLNNIENHLKQNAYICGDQFTAADVYLASHLAFGVHVTKSYVMRPVFDDYTKRCFARPAKQRAQ